MEELFRAIDGLDTVVVAVGVVVSSLELVLEENSFELLFIDGSFLCLDADRAWARGVVRRWEMEVSLGETSVNGL